MIRPGSDYFANFNKLLGKYNNLHFEGLQIKLLFRHNYCGGVWRTFYTLMNITHY